MSTSKYQSNVLAKRTLLLAAGAMGFAQTVLFAILAPLGREVGLVEVQIGAIISASSLTLFLVSPLWGRASDQWGRRKILLIGLFGYSIGTVMFAGVFQAALLGYLVPVTAPNTFNFNTCCQRHGNGSGGTISKRLHGRYYLRYGAD